MDAQLKASLPDRVCGVRFHPRSLRIIRETIADHPTACRAEITRAVCDQLGWLDAMGRHKALTASQALRDFHQRGWITLPAPQTVRSARGVTPAADRIYPPPDPSRLVADPFCVTLQDIKGLCLDQVDTGDDFALSQNLLAHHHYRGAIHAVGAQRRYLIQSDQGCLGVMVFSAAARHLQDRDQWIGWDSAARRERRHLIVNNSRFLILPWVRVPHLASHLLSLAARQVVPDFQQQYGYAPVLLETFVEDGRYRGTSYRAANWIKVGHTQGRGRNDTRPQSIGRTGPPILPIKSIWIRPLGRSDRVRATLMGAAPKKARGRA